MRSRGRAGWAVVVLAGCRLEAPDADAFAGASEGAMGTTGTTAGPVGEATTGSTEASTEASASTSEGGGTESSAGLDASSEGEGTTGTSETSAGTSDTSAGTSDTSAGTSEGTSTGPLGFCGDGNIDPGEVCDDGVNDGSYGGCAGDCQLAPFCGNGIVDGPEACDDGVNDGAYGGCLGDCLALAERCGDGVINGPELCDDGVNDGAYGGCALGCLALGPYCGDGVVSELEVCDDGVNDGSYDGCAPGCLALAAYCGDGLVDAVEACDDGVNDGAYAGCATGCAVLAEHCGDGIVSGPELCDGADLGGQTCASEGFIGGVLGCSGSCSLDTGECTRVSCQDILDHDPTATSGVHPIDVDGDGPLPPFDVYCDMDTDGGGWTELTLALGCTLGAELSAVQSATTAGIDAECRPFTRDSGNEVHTYHYTVPFPPGFTQIMPIGYVARANAAVGDVSDISSAGFTQTLWGLANNGSSYGDVSFGAAEEPGPITSFSAAGVTNMCLSCDIPYPGNGVIYTLGIESQALRLGWGESGGESEGWYPWWSGGFRVR